MLWCTELDTAENFGLTSIQKPLIAISKCPLLNIHPVLCVMCIVGLMSRNDTTGSSTNYKPKTQDKDSPPGLSLPCPRFVSVNISF